jgi:hypothetical protein
MDGPEERHADRHTNTQTDHQTDRWMDTIAYGWRIDK